MIEEMEIALIFYTALFFTVLFLLARQKGFQLFFGALTTLTWMILGVIFIASNPNFPPIAYLFVAIGLCFALFIVWLSFHKPEETEAEFSGKS